MFQPWIHAQFSVPIGRIFARKSATKLTPNVGCKLGRQTKKLNSMKHILIVILVINLLSCDWAKRKTKETVHKGGEIVAKTGSEFVDGISKGIEKTFENEVLISDELTSDGLETGKIIISSTDSTTDNILSVYIIFTKDFDKIITVKVFDENGLEYGRTNELITGKTNEAEYFDFIFDRRTNINGKGKLTIE